MRVRCTNNKRPNQDSQYQSLTQGKEYTVLAIEFYDKTNCVFCNTIGDFTVYRIRGNDGVIMPFPAILFEITSDRMPSSWVIYNRKEGMYTILPKPWAREYFWDDYYNDEDSAVDSLKSEEQTMLLE